MSSGQTTTFSLLVAKYDGQPYVAVETIVPEYFGVNRIPEIRRKMRSGDLGLRPVILGVKMFVDLQELAEILDKGRDS